MMAKTILTALLHDERGATAVEYGLICALIVIAILGVLSSVAMEAITMWSQVPTTSSKAIDHATR